MLDGTTHTDRGDVQKIAALVFIVLVLFASFFGAFPARNGLHSFFLEDKNGTLSVDQVANVPPLTWQDSKGHTLNAGYTNSTYWVKAQLPQWSEGEHLLVVNFPLLEHITLYRLHPSGGLTPPQTFGAAYPFDDRPVSAIGYVVPLGSADNGATVLLKVNTRSSMQVPLEWWTVDAFSKHQQEVAVFHGAYLGVVVAMFLYNILLYAVIREKAYVWYIGWMVFMALFVVTVNGMAFRWLWPNQPGLSFISVPVTLSLGIACACKFFIGFLDERGCNVWLFRGIVSTCIGIAVTTPLLTFQTSTIAAIVLAMFMVTAATWIALRRAYQGHAAASYFLMAFSFVITGGVVLALNKFGVLPRTFATEYAAELGSAIEMVVLSFAIIARFNSQRRAREQAQNQLLLAEQQRTVELENHVKTRTAELEKANGQLLALSRIDALTGMFNRRYLYERMHEELRRVNRACSSVAVMVIDVDHFKRLNDNHGHQVGDFCLETIAKSLMQSCVRPGDIAARYGGEEFMVLAPDIDRAGAETFAEKLRQHIANLEIQTGDLVLQVTVSIGVCWRLSQGTLSGDELVAAADQALYQAKENGRNRVVLAPHAKQV